MSAKRTTVVLECPPLNITAEEYEINHAERLLRMPNNGGWRLPGKTPFEFSNEYGIRVRTHKKGNSGTTETGDDK